MFLSLWISKSRKAKQLRLHRPKNARSTISPYMIKGYPECIYFLSLFLNFFICVDSFMFRRHGDAKVWDRQTK